MEKIENRLNQPSQTKYRILQNQMILDLSQSHQLRRTFTKNLFQNK